MNLIGQSTDDAPNRIAFDAFVLDMVTGELRRDGSIVQLQPIPTRALMLLVARAGSLVTRDELRAHVWPDALIPMDENLNTCIRQVRAALGDDGAGSRFIQTVPRRGYRFVGSTVSPQQELPRSWSVRPLAAAVLTLVVGLVATVLVVTRGADPLDATLLKGEHLLRDLRHPNALRYLDSVVVRDPVNARAIALLARARLLAGDRDGAERAAERSLALAPNAAEAHHAVAEIAARMTWSWTEALEHYAAALAQAPRNVDVLLGRAELLSLLGRHAEAISDARAAVAIDPVMPVARGDLAWIHYRARRYSDAASHARETLAVSRDPLAAYCLVLALEASADTSGARDAALQILRRYHADSARIAAFAASSAEAALDDFWRWDAEQLRRAGAVDRLPLDMAAVFARFGNRDSAMAYVQRALEHRVLDAPLIVADPRFDPLRSDSSFVSAVNLVLGRLADPSGN